MLPLVGSLATGIFSVLIFWATISLGGTPRPKTGARASAGAGGR